MTALFNHILNTGITAGILVLIVVLLRFLLKKAPKYVNVLLWGIVALRLIMPISIESSLSLVPKTDWIASENPTVSLYSPESNIEGAESPDFIIDNPAPTQTPTENIPQTPVQNVPQTPVQTTPQAPTTPITPEPTPTVPAENSIRITDVLPYVWLGGVAVMLIYMALSYYRVHRSIKVVKKLRDNIYLANTDSPFVLGIIKPKIYLPADLDEFSASYVIAHEETHIRRRDHWWKPLGFLLLSVHWFNPLLWLSYILLCKDIEMACDERVVRDMASAERANYSEALLACSISKRVVSACPLAFGEVSVKERIRSVLSYKKPAFWIVLIAVIACIATAVCFLTNPVATSDTEEEETDIGSLEKELPDLLERMYLYEGYYNEAVGIEIDHNDRILDIDSRFCKITDERFDTSAEWVAFAETVFTGAELDRVKSVLEEYVIEIDEHAYINDRVVSVWKFDENTYSIIEEDDTSATVELVRTRVVVGNEAVETYIWTCALEKTDAGWRISDISAEKGVPLIPKEWQWLEYEGFTHDLSTVNDKIFRIGEPERIGRHIIVKCALTSGETIYVVINASNPYQQYKHSFEGERIAYHSHDVNSIVYSNENKIYRYDGSVVYEHDDPSEFINAIEYIDNNLTLIITLKGSTRSRTVSVDLSNPTEGHIFEYGGISYDLSSETYSHIQGVLECARVGKHVVAYGDTVGKNGGIFFVINTETHEIENHFIGSILTYHGDDVNTIVYGFLGKIYSYDGTLIAAPEKGYISTMKYVSNFTQLEVTFQTGDTVIVDLPPESPTDAPMETPIDTPNIDGGSSRCKHTVMAGYNDIDFAYHSVPGALISYVGSDRFDEWIRFYENNEEVFRTEYNEGKRDCPYGSSIVDFVEYFEIPREVFEILILSNGLGYDFNIDAIYAGKEAAEEYYSSDRTQLCLAKAIIFSIKRSFPHYMYTIGATASETEWRESKLENGWYGTVLLEKVTEQYEAENKDTSKLPDAPPLDYSLTEYVHTFDIPREKVEEHYSTLKEKWGFTGDFDLDALYAAEFDEEYFKTTNPLEIDMQFFTYDGK